MNAIIRYAHGVRFAVHREKKASREGRGLILAIMLAAAVALALLSDATPSAAFTIVGS